MAQVYSRQLGDVFFSAGSNLDITRSSFFPGKQVVLRTIQLSWAPYSVSPPGTLGPIFAVELTTGSGAQTAFLSLDPNLGPNPVGNLSMEWQGHMALGPADVLSVVCSALADPLAIGNVVASGYLLSLP